MRGRSLDACGLRIDWNEEPMLDPEKLIEIQLVGIENLNRRGRPPQPGIKFYGKRVTDMAERLLVIELKMHDAEDIIDYMASHKDMPSIEVPNNTWAYVGILGENEAKFKQEGP